MIFYLLTIGLLVVELFAQRLCHNPNYNASLDDLYSHGWCSKMNPFSTITHLLTDKSFPDEFYVEYCLKDADPLNEICSNIASIQTTEWSYKNENGEMVDHRIVVFSLKNRAIVVTNFNDPHDSKVIHEPSKDIQEELTMDFVSWNNTAWLFYGEKTKLSLFKIGIDIGNDSIRIKNWNLSSNEILDELKLFSNNGELFISFITKSLDESFKLYIYKILPDGIIINLYSPIKFIHASEYLDMKVVPHFCNFNSSYNSIYVEDATEYTRSIILIHDSKRAFLFSLPNLNDSEVPFEIDLRNTNTFSRILDLNDNTKKLIRAHLVLESIRHVDLNLSNCTYIKDKHNSQRGHFVFVLQDLNTFENRLNIMNLPEFEKYIYNNETNWLNPLERTVICSNFEYWNGSSCSKSYLKEITSKIESSDSQPILRHRFVATPTVKSTQGVRTYQIEDICNLFISSESNDLCKIFKSNCMIEAVKSPFHNLVYERFMHDVLFLATNNIIETFDLITDPFNSTKPVFEIFNASTIYAVGKILDMYVSQNAAHMFLAVSRYKWEFNSSLRYEEACNIFQSGSDDIVNLEFKKKFENLGKLCNILPATRPDLNFFSQFVTSCPPGFMCPSLRNFVLNRVPMGYYSIKTNQAIPCPKGSFCIYGIKLPCTPGMICNEEKMIKPLPCEHKGTGFSCVEGGLSNYSACFEGSICNSPSSPPILAPPGYYIEINGDERTIKPCWKKDYCPIARQVIVPKFNYTNIGVHSLVQYSSFSNDNENDRPDYTLDLRCPENTYCPNTTVLLPTMCQVYNNCNIEGNYCIEYCPMGTDVPSKCTAGYFCSNFTSKIECENGMYCPEGSMFYFLCPEGYYCNTPKEKEICPRGKKCPKGSFKPRDCTFLAKCTFNSGMSSNEHWLYGFLITAPVLFIIGLISCNCLFFFGKVSSKIFTSKKNKKKINLFSSTNDSDTSNLYDIFDIEFNNLDLKLPSSQLLHNVSGVLEGGSLTAVMGPSGCGKSSLLQALIGLHPAKLTGNIYVNGIKFSNLSNLASIIGNVPQTDVLERRLTVKENIKFSAYTRMKPLNSFLYFQHKKIDERVNALIDLMDMNHISDTIVGDENRRGISGGQLKKVNCSLEIAINPKVLILDEPTSGLDGATSFTLMEALKNISRIEKVTTAAVIHQPREELFFMCDNLLLLKKGGYVCYMGKTKDCVEYLNSIGVQMSKKYNVADFVIDLMSEDWERYPIDAISQKPQLKYIHNNPKSPSDLAFCWEQYCINENTNFYISKSEKIIIEQNISASNEEYKEVIQSQDINHNHGYLNRKSLRMNTPKDVTKKQLDKLIKSERKRRPAACLIQFIYCLLRDLKILKVEFKSFLTSIFLVCVGAIFLGFVFFKLAFKQGAPDWLWKKCPDELQNLCKQPVSNPIIHQAGLTGLTVALCALMSSLSTFTKPNAVYLRESMSGLGAFPYYISKSIVDAILQVVASIIFTLVYYVAIAPRSNIIISFGIVFLVYSTSFSLGYLLGTLIPFKNSKLAGVILLMILQLFSGMVPRLEEFYSMGFPWKYIPYASYLRYTTELFYLSEITLALDKLNNNDINLKAFSYYLGDEWMCIGIVVGIQLIFRILACLSLWTQTAGSIPYTIIHKILNSKLIQYIIEISISIVKKSTEGYIFSLLTCFIFEKKVSKNESNDLKEQLLENNYEIESTTYFEMEDLTISSV